MMIIKQTKYRKNLKVLYTFMRHGIKNMSVEPNESFAEKVGKIARLYIDFKQNNDETDNSLSDILTYSKYDREKLRFVVKRVGLGIQLSKINDAKKDLVTQQISKLQPKEEIEDVVASRDYSYFFFKGYYSNKEIEA